MKTEQTLLFRLYIVVTRISQWLLPPNRNDELYGDLFVEAGNPILDRINAVCHIFRSELKRNFYPGIRVSDLMPFGQRVASYGRMYFSICRINGTWLTGYFVAAASGTFMLPDRYMVDAWLPLFFGAIAATLLGVYREGFRSKPKRDEFLLISISGYEQKLKAWITTLFSGIWNPKLGRSSLETLLFASMSFGPAIALIRWASGDSLFRDDQDWASVGIRTVGIVMLMWTWFYVKEANRRVAKILEDEFRRTEFTKPAD